MEWLLTAMYKNAARDLRLQSIRWKGTEIIATNEDGQRLCDALNRLSAKSVEYAKVAEDNVRTILCIPGALANTFPVVRIVVMDSVKVKTNTESELILRLVNAASYIQFYRKRCIFLPKLLQKKIDAKANEFARLTARRASKVLVE